MKNMILGLILISGAISAHAAPQRLAPCDARGISALKESILDKRADGFVNVKLMTNTNGKVLGFYTWNKAGDDMYAEVCEYLETREYVAASQWYYWENDGYKTNPASWVKGASYFIAQDEGTSTMKLLKPSVDGNITVLMDIEGTDEEAGVVRREIVNFVNLR